MDVFFSIVIIGSLLLLVGYLSYDLIRSIKKYRERKKFNKDRQDGCKEESQENEHSK